MRSGALFSIAVGLAGLLAGGCGAPRPAPRPSPLDLGDARPAPRVQRLRVLVRVDDRYRAVPGHRDRIGEVVDSASDQLAARFGLHLDLVRIDTWAPGAATEAPPLLDALEALPVPDDVDLVIGVSAAPPPRRARMDDLARARYLGRSVLLRSLTPYFSPAARRALHDAEVLALMHGVGRVFGALPTCGTGVMSDRLDFRRGDPTAWRWHPTNLALVRLHAALDLRRGATRLPPDVARRAAATLEAAPAPLRSCGERVTRRRALWAEVAGGEQPEPAAPPAAPTGSDAAVAGRAALTAGDAAGALALCEPVAARHPASEAARCAAEAAEAAGDEALAVRYWRAHLAHHPDDEDALLRLARLVGRAGDDGAARALLAAFVETHPDHLRARLNLGVALARLGDYAGARRQWQAILDRAPEHADARQLIEQLPR